MTKLQRLYVSRISKDTIIIMKHHDDNNDDDDGATG